MNLSFENKVALVTGQAPVWAWLAAAFAAEVCVALVDINDRSADSTSVWSLPA